MKLNFKDGRNTKDRNPKQKADRTLQQECQVETKYLQWSNSQVGKEETTENNSTENVEKKNP